MISQNQLISDKLMYDFCSHKEILFCHKQIKEKLMFILQLTADICN